jgi:hypothetical protein
MPEKVLLVCTSSPANVRRAIERFPQDPVFLDYQLDLLCPSGDLPDYQSWTNLRQLLPFPKRGSYWAAFRLWARLIRERYAAVVVLWCLDPGRRLSKLFALVCNGRRILVFNENLDCAFLSFGFLRLFLRARARAKTFDGGTLARVVVASLKQGSRRVARIFLLPFRLLVLLISVADLYLKRRGPA